MTAPQSTPLPPAGQRGEPEDIYIAKQNAFVAAQEPFRQELQAQANFVDVKAADLDNAVTASEASASAALTSENNAESSAAAALDSKNSAAANESEVAALAASALDSKNAASSSEINARNSELSVAADASAAEASEIISTTKASEAEASATSSADSAALSEDARILAQAAGNYAGVWADLTGPVAAGVSVAHLGEYWGSLFSITDVTLSEPGVSSDWQSITELSGTAAQRDTGTNFDQIPLNTNIIYPVATVADLRLLEPTVDGQRFNVTSYYAGWAATVRGPVGGGEFVYDASDATSEDDGGSIIVSDGGKRFKRKDAYEATAEDFGLLVGSNDMTSILQSYADFACNESKLFSLPVGVINTGPLIFVNSAGLTVKGASSFGTTIKPISISNDPIFKFSLPDETGAAISGLTVEDLEFNAAGYTGPLMSAASIFDSTLFQRIRADRFSGAAIELRSREIGKTVTYNFLEGVTVNKCVFIGDDKQFFTTTTPMIDVYGNANEFDIKDTKFYLQRSNPSFSMNDQASLDHFNSRPAIRHQVGTTRGWAIHECSFVNAMNTRVLDFQGSGVFHRIYSNMFERFGEFGSLGTGEDACLIYMNQSGGSAQKLGGSIENNRVEVPVELEKTVYLNNCRRVLIKNNGWQPKDVYLGNSQLCSIESVFDNAATHDSNQFRNCIESTTGDIKNITSQLNVARRNDTESNEENAAFPTISWSGSIESDRKQHVIAKLNNNTFDSMESSRLDFSTAIGSASEAVALTIRYGTIKVGTFAGVPFINGNRDPRAGGVVYDSTNDRFLFRHASGWKTPTMTDV